MSPKYQQQLILTNRQLHKEVWKWKVIAFCLAVLASVLFAKSVHAAEFSTVTLCDHPVPKLFVGAEREQERQAEIQWRNESFRTQVCDSLPLLGKAPYGLKYKTGEWQFSFKLFLKR